MPNWITHLIIVDKLFAMGINLDERGFAVGNIAPDCNVENDDWTRFTPSREITHWMKGEGKLSVDYEGFFEEYIREKGFLSNEHKAFLWGYYSHLVTDVEFQKYIRNVERVKNTYKRLKENVDMHSQIKNLPKDFDTLKKVFGKINIFNDIIIQEINYLKENPKSRYTTIIKEIHDFPDYIDYFPKGAIVRKIGIMAKGDISIKSLEKYYFFTQGELNEFVKETSGLIFKLMHEKLYNVY